MSLLHLIQKCKILFGITSRPTKPVLMNNRPFGIRGSQRSLTRCWYVTSWVWKWAVHPLMRLDKKKQQAYCSECGCIFLTPHTQRQTGSSEEERVSGQCRRGLAHSSGTKKWGLVTHQISWKTYLHILFYCSPTSNTVKSVVSASSKQHGYKMKGKSMHRFSLGVTPCVRNNTFQTVRVAVTYVWSHLSCRCNDNMSAEERKHTVSSAYKPCSVYL